MRKTTQVLATVVLMVLGTAIAFGRSMPRKATWHDFEGVWVGDDPGSGAFFRRIVLNEDKTGTCVVLLSEDTAWLYRVSVLSWDENWHITLRFVPVTGTDDKPYEMESVEGIGLTLREKGVKKPNRAREVQLRREAGLKGAMNRAEKLAEKIK